MTRQRQPPRLPLGGGSADKVADQIRSLQEEMGEAMGRLLRRVESADVRTDRNLRELAEEWERERRHLHDRIDRLGETVQATADALRADLQDHERGVMETAVRGAAEGAGKAAGDSAAATAAVVAHKAAKGFWATWPGKLTAGASGFTALVVAVNNIPDFVRGWDKFWKFLGGH